jgi:hypothetical protein
MNDFTIDQLGAILYNWGRVQVPALNLRLGYRLSDGRSFLVGIPEDGNNLTTIWIVSTSTTGVTSSGAGTDYYDAVVPR